jgi:iron complex outermembrane receptor protein
MQGKARVLAAVALAWAALVAPVPGAAQESEAERQPAVEPAAPPPAGSPAARRSGVEAITVTARKREENLQEVPIAVTAFSADDLRQREINTVGDIRLSTPNLQFLRGYDATSSSRVYIRGVGQDDVIATTDAGVGLYVDGVYIARSQGALFDLLDVERIEVLRGPQGTLYGRNTIGGAVNVISTKPTGEWGGRGEVRLGNYDLFETKGSIDFPILAERLAGRFSFVTATADGFSRNTAQRNHYNDKKLLAGRGTLRFTPTEDLELMLSGERSRQHQKSGFSDCIFINDAAGLWGLLQLTQYATFKQSCNQTQEGDLFTFAVDAPNQGDVDVWASSLHGTWELSENLTLKGITAWRRNLTERTFDVDNSPVHITHLTGQPSEIDQISYELQLLGNSWGERLNWVGGLYWFREQGHDDEVQTVVPGARFNPGVPGLGGLPLEAILGPLGRDGDTEVANLSYAAFGQATMQLTSMLSFTGGLRYTQERKELDIVNRCNLSTLAALPGDPRCARPLLDFKRSERFSAWTPMASLSLQLTDDLMLYGGWSRGFKSGGFNGRPSAGSATDLEGFEPEYVSAWEGGIKSTWLDGRLVANLAAYQSDYDDVQVATVEFLGPRQFIVTRNAAEATIKGAELEVSLTPLEGLDLRASWGIIDAEIDEFEERLANGTIRDRSDEDFRNSPDWNYSLSAQYSFPIGRFGTLTARSDYYAQAPSWAAQEPTDNDLAHDLAHNPKYHIFNARLGWLMPNGKTELALWGRNLSNEIYLTSFAAVYGAFGSLGRTYSEPRTYGMEISHEF